MANGRNILLGSKTVLVWICVRNIITTCYSKIVRLDYIHQWLLTLVPRKSQVYILTGNLSGTPLPPLALRHVAPRILGRVLLPSAAKKVGLDPPRLHFTLSCHVNHRFYYYAHKTMQIYNVKKSLTPINSSILFGFSLKK